MTWIGLALIFLAGILAGRLSLTRRIEVLEEANNLLVEDLVRRDLQQAMVDEVRRKLSTRRVEP